MICGNCCKIIDAVDLIICNGCKLGYHYRCVNITSAAFNDGQAQIMRNFKCDSCANVTQRIRVTDDTPVRSLRAGMIDSHRDKQRTQSFDKNGSKESELLAATDTTNLVDVMEKVNTMILEKLSALESKILEEIKDTVRVLALENSKLTQKLQEANEKCVSYEQEIKTLRSKKQAIKESNISSTETPLDSRPAVSESRSKAVRTPPPNRDNVDQQHETPKIELQQSIPIPSYATVAKKPADTISNANTWVEVRKNKRNDLVRRGGNVASSTLKAVERKKFLHVWRLEKTTSDDTLKKYIQNVLQNESEIIVEKLKPRTERDYASFKIGVTEGNYEKLCDPEVWPVNVEFSEWVFFRRATIPIQLQT